MEALALAGPQILGGLATSLIGGLMGGKEKAAPTPAAPKVAPVPDNKMTKRADQRNIQRKYGDMGRASTMLSDEGSLG